MMYLTTFFLTLLLAHIARAAPRGCHDLISPETETNQHGLDAQVPAPFPLKATFDQTFDNPSGSLNGVACSNGQNGLVTKYPTFGKIPRFPYIGGAYDIEWNSTNCGSCWEIYNPSNGRVILITAIDTAGAGFNIAKKAYDDLSGGSGGGGALVVNAWKISNKPCH